LKRRRLEKPLAKAISVTGNVVSVRSCFASRSRRVCISSMGETPSSCCTIRRNCRELMPNCSAISSKLAPSSVSPSFMRCTICCAMRCAWSKGAWPGANSGRQRKQGRKRSFSAASALSKKRQFLSCGVFTVQTGRQ
jgi:hypothetical protein